MPHVPVFGELDFDYLQALVGDAKSAVLDIGANDGTETNRLLEAFPNAIVYAFEPDPRAIAKFKNNVKSDRARLFECAIGAADGTAVFHVSSGLPAGIPEAELPLATASFPEGWDQSGSLRAPKACLQTWPWLKFERQITVQVMALDTFFRQESLTGIDLIWADIQGAESDLIDGGRLALSKTRYVYTEYGAEEYYEGQATLDQILESLPDFKLLEQFSMDVLLENQILRTSSGGFAAFRKRLRKALFS